jgi:hypothetical protein
MAPTYNPSSSFPCFSHGRISKRQACTALILIACVATSRRMHSTTLNVVASSSVSKSHLKSGLPFLLLPNSTDATAEKRVLPFLLLPNSTDATAEQRVLKQIGDGKASKKAKNPLHNCAITTQVRILRQDSQWLMQSIDAQGNDKGVGGDEFYVTYSDNNEHNGNGYGSETRATAVALITDSQNGTYLLDFVTTPMNPKPSNLTGAGILTVYFQYSCGIGRMYQPLKDSWGGGGSSMTSLSTKTIEPPLRMFQPPRDHGIDLSKFNLTISFGDSLMENLVKELHGGKFYRPSLHFKVNIDSDLNMKTLPVILRKLEKWHKNELGNTNKSVALILGSSMWDVLQPTKTQGLNFTDHLNACSQYVKKIRKLYPTVTIFWKTPSTARFPL